VNCGPYESLAKKIKKACYLWGGIRVKEIEERCGLYCKKYWFFLFSKLMLRFTAICIAANIFRF